MAKPFGGKRPQDLRHTLRRFRDYLGRHIIMLGVVGLLAAVSALADEVTSAQIADCTDENALRALGVLLEENGN